LKPLDKEVQGEKLYRQLVENSKDMLFHLSNNGEFNYVNRAALELTGYTPEELKGASISMLLKKESWEVMRKLFAKQFDELTVDTYHEFQILRKDGRHVWTGINIRLESDNGDLHLAGIARNISERIRIEKRQQNKISQLLVLLENLQEGVLVEDENRRVLLVNRSFCDLFSVTLIPEDIIGRDYINALNHILKLFKDKKHFTEHDTLLVKNKNIQIGHTLELTDGRIFERDYIPIFIETGYAGNLWKYRDSTEKNVIKNSLIKSEKKYKSVIDTMRLGLLEVDRNDKIITANDSFCEILCYNSAADLIGKPAFETLLDEEQQQLMMEQMSKRQEGISNAYEIKVKKADGGEAWMLISGAPLYDEKDNVIGSVGVHLDISYQKRMAIEMEEKKALQNQMAWQEKAMEHLEEKVQERTSEVVKQKEIIERKNREITNSINYSLQIQEALLPKKEEIYQSLTNCFVLYKPKDIVSGDFYFFRKTQDNFCHIAAADSTGHGVPGAFMSMLGSEKLKVAADKAVLPGEILSHVNVSLKNSLHNNDNERSVKDGYDIALCTINLNSIVVDSEGVKKPAWSVHFSGAHRPLWIIRKDSQTIEIIKGTKASIGGWTSNSHIFETQHLHLHKGDTLYICSDGFADQFGKTGKRLMTKKFRELLLTIQDKTMQEQELFLDNFIEDWRGEEEQTDDILVIGIRF
jgi:PAS domain S-box-containing protein